MMIGLDLLVNKHVTDYRTVRTTMMIGLVLRLINKHVTDYRTVRTTMMIGLVLD